MARITVEDCMDLVENRFELVLVASQRAKDIASGGELTISRDEDKDTVVALREIAGSNISVASMEEVIIRGMQKSSEVDELELLEGQEEEAEEKSTLAADSVDEDLEGEAVDIKKNVEVEGLSFDDDNLDVDD